MQNAIVFWGVCKHYTQCSHFTYLHSLVVEWIVIWLHVLII